MRGITPLLEPLDELPQWPLQLSSVRRSDGTPLAVVDWWEHMFRYETERPAGPHRSDPCWFCVETPEGRQVRGTLDELPDGIVVSKRGEPLAGFLVVGGHLVKRRSLGEMLARRGLLR